LSGVHAPGNSLCRLDVSRNQLTAPSQVSVEICPSLSCGTTTIDERHVFERRIDRGTSRRRSPSAVGHPHTDEKFITLRIFGRF